MQNPSRRRTAQYIAAQLAQGESPRRIAKMLAAYLVTSKQTRSADLLIRDIETALFHNHGHLVANAASARRLSAKVKTDLVKLLQHETGARTVELMETIDEELIGGVVVRTPETELDTSLRTKLTRLKAI